MYHNNVMYVYIMYVYITLLYVSPKNLSRIHSSLHHLYCLEIPFLLYISFLQNTCMIYLCRWEKLPSYKSSSLHCVIDTEWPHLNLTVFDHYLKLLFFNIYFIFLVSVVLLDIDGYL